MQSRAGLAQLGIINTARRERGAIGIEIDKYVIAHRVPKVRRSGLVKKITLWGSLATIISLFVSIFWPQATSENQTTYGNQSPNISNVQGNVSLTISGQSASPPAGKQYVLRNSRGGAVAILNTPRSGAVTDVKQHACEPIISGTSIELLNDKSSGAGIDIWRKVKVIDGVCSGKIGWVMVSDISFE